MKSLKIFTFLLVLSILIIQVKTQTKSVTVKDENLTDNPIKLIPGRAVKIYVIGTPSGSIFSVKLNNKNMTYVRDSWTTTFAGKVDQHLAIYCESEIPDSDIGVVKYLSLGATGSATNIEFPPFPVIVIREKTIIDISPILTSLPTGAFGSFRLQNSPEPYCYASKLTFSFRKTENNKNEQSFAEDVQIELDDYRDYTKTENLNLVVGKYGVALPYNEEQTFSEFEIVTNCECFVPKISKFNFTNTNEPIPAFNDTDQKKIVDTFHQTNFLGGGNFEFEFKVDKYPGNLHCLATTESFPYYDSYIIEKTTENIKNTYFHDMITKSGTYRGVIPNMMVNSEFNFKCIIESPVYDDSSYDTSLENIVFCASNKIEGCDIKKSFIVNDYQNFPNQCITLTLSQRLNKFYEQAEIFCLQTINPEIKELSDINSVKIDQYGCLYCGADSSNGEICAKFNVCPNLYKHNPVELFQKVKDGLSTEENIKKNTGTTGISVISMEYIKNDEDPNDLVSFVSMTKNGNTLTFNLISHSNTNIVCKYSNSFSKYFINKYMYSNLNAQVILRPNVTTQVSGSIYFYEDSFHSLLISCDYSHQYLKLNNQNVKLIKSQYDTENEVTDYEEKEKIDCKNKTNSGKYLQCILKPKREFITEANYVNTITLRNTLIYVENFVGLDESYQRYVLNKQNDTVAKSQSTYDIETKLYKSIQFAKLLLARECYTSKDFDTCLNEKKGYFVTLLDIFKTFGNNCTAAMNNIRSQYSTREVNVNYTIAEYVILLGDIAKNYDIYSDNAKTDIQEYLTCLNQPYEKLDILKNKEKDINLILAQIPIYLSESQKYLTKDGILIDKVLNNENGLHVTTYGKEAKNKFEDFIINNLLIYGTNNYEFDNSYIIIEKRGELSSSDDKMTTIGKKVKIITNTNKLFNQYSDGEYISITLYKKYPLLSINNNEKSLYESFISLKMYKKDGTPLDIKDIKEENRPILYFPLSEGFTVDKCIYFNENENKLKTDGISSSTTTYLGNKLTKCTISHFSDFSVSFKEGNQDDSGSEDKGDEEKEKENEDQNKEVSNVIIIGLIAIAVIIILIFCSCLIKNRLNKKIIDSNKVEGEFSSPLTP